MKWVHHVQTADGKLHNDALVGKRHAENVYDLSLTELAHRAVHKADKFSSMKKFIADNLQAFVALSDLKKDIELEKPEEEWTSQN